MPIHLSIPFSAARFSHSKSTPTLMWQSPGPAVAVSWMPMCMGCGRERMMMARPPMQQRPSLHPITAAIPSRPLGLDPDTHLRHVHLAVRQHAKRLLHRLERVGHGEGGLDSLLESVGHMVS